MRVQIRDDEVIGYGVEIHGDDTYEGAPEDYEFGKYIYTPKVSGEFDPEGFTLIQIVDEENSD